MAASLSAGQSRKIVTGLTGATLTFGSEAANFIQWGNSAYYDPTRKEVGFIGKRQSTFPYHWLVYDEASNTWSNDRAVWSTDSVSGHGYDHNTIDPATGDVYHRPFNSATVRVWSGSWSTLAAIGVTINVAGGLTWFPGVGLIYNDGNKVLRYSAGSWSTLQNLGGNSYHDFGEYNSTANVLIFGGGNGSTYYKMTGGLTITSIASPSVTFGAASTHGPLISDPASANLIGWSATDGTWHRYNIDGDSWHSLSKVSGDGSSPEAGLPNWATNTSLEVIGCPISAHGVQMWIRRMGDSATPADVWIYKHA